MSTAKKSTHQKLASSRAKMYSLAAQLQEESDLFDLLMVELEIETQEATGLTGLHITVGHSKPQHDQVIFKTIQSLRNGQLSFDEIATKLIIRGHKTKDLNPWTGLGVKEFFEDFDGNLVRRIA